MILCYICVTIVLQNNITMRATADIYLDPRQKATGKCSVKIKITHNRKRKYFSTGIDLTQNEFKKIMTAQRRNREQKATLTKLETFNPHCS